jgi:hypothetical protein
VVLVLDWGALLALGALLPDFDVHGAAGALVTAVIAAALNALVWPTLSRLALPLSVLTLGGAAIVLNCPNAAAHVRRTDGFPHCPDLLVNASFSSDTEEVAAFEELVGWHGGMGGSQSLPFVLFPSDLPSLTRRWWAEHMHRVLRRWLVELGHDACRDEAEVTAGGGGGCLPASR